MIAIAKIAVKGNHEARQRQRTQEELPECSLHDPDLWAGVPGQRIVETAQHQPRQRDHRQPEAKAPHVQQPVNPLKPDQAPKMSVRV